MFTLATLASAGLSLAGTGLSAYGAYQQVGLAKNYAERERAIAQDEQKKEGIRWSAARFAARRTQLEDIRKFNRMSAMAIQGAANGAGGLNSSGVQGGQAQLSGDLNTALAGVTGNLGLAGQMFNLNQDIYGQKMAQATIQGDMATAQGYGALGGALVQSAPAFGRIVGLFG